MRTSGQSGNDAKIMRTTFEHGHFVFQLSNGRYNGACLSGMGSNGVTVTNFSVTHDFGTVSGTKLLLGTLLYRVLESRKG